MLSIVQEVKSSEGLLFVIIYYYLFDGLFESGLGFESQTNSIPFTVCIGPEYGTRSHKNANNYSLFEVHLGQGDTRTLGASLLRNELNRITRSPVPATPSSRSIARRGASLSTMHSF